MRELRASRKRGIPPLRIEVGARIRDTNLSRDGVVLDLARQYAHPQAKPVYSYLIRWEDGAVQALSETAFQRDYGFEVLDEEPR